MHRIIAAVLISIAFTFTSCEKVINIDVNDADQKVVIEAWINEGTHKSGTVKLSYSQKFSSTDNSLPVTNAFVTITDVQGNIVDTLIENGTTPGFYETTKLTGTTDHNYQLFVHTNNQEFTASTKLLKAINLDSMYQEDYTFFGDTSKQVIPVFQDPLGEENF